MKTHRHTSKPISPQPAPPSAAVSPQLDLPQAADSPQRGLPSTAIKVIEALESAGFETWCVGGCVRNILMQRPLHDIDIASAALWQEAQQVFEARGWHTHETGTKHGTLTVIVDGEAIEVTTYRTEGPYSDHRRPDSVRFVSSITEDLARRDFTMNALALHPTRGLLDPYGGAEDIAQRCIRAVGDPVLRFTEDALRVLRACRFASQLGFHIEEETFAALRACAELLHDIARERIVAELNAFMLGAYAGDALIACVEVLAHPLPELTPMKGFEQRSPYHHLDVLEHTACTLQLAKPDLLVRWAALFHDSGKPQCFTTDERGVGHFYGHAKAGAEITNEALRRLGMGSSFSHDVVALVAHHDDVIEAAPKLVKRALRRLDGRIDLFFALCELRRADCLAHAPEHRGGAKAADRLRETLERIIEQEEALSIKDLAIDGNDLIALGMEPGPQMGQLLHAAFDAVIDEQLENSREALLAFSKNKLDEGFEAK